jgi:hypothetical protein
VQVVPSLQLASCPQHWDEDASQAPPLHVVPVVQLVPSLQSENSPQQVFAKESQKRPDSQYEESLQFPPSTQGEAGLHATQKRSKQL